MASLSERLKRERELRGISLKQISEETRIGVRFLEALEEGKLDVIPGEFYRRSYLRAYARYLGLDEDRAVNAYDYSRKETRVEEGEPTEPAPLKLPSWLKWVVAGLAVALPALLLLRAMPAATNVPEAVEAADLVEAASAEPAPPMPIRSLEPNGAEEPIEAGPPNELPLSIPSGAGPLRLSVSVQESCWLEIEADGEIVVSGLKEAGFRSRVVGQRELRLWLGNAGGVLLTLNDQPVKPLGRAGQVRKDLFITLENIRDYVAPGGGQN